MRSRQFFNIYCDLLYLEWKFDHLNIKLARVNMKSDVFNRLLCPKKKKRLLNALKRFKAFKTLLHFKKRFKWNRSPHCSIGYFEVSPVIQKIWIQYWGHAEIPVPSPQIMREKYSQLWHSKLARKVGNSPNLWHPPEGSHSPQISPNVTAKILMG